MADEPSREADTLAARIRAQQAAFFAERLGLHGPDHRSVDIKSLDAQRRPYLQMLKLLDDEGRSINDFGCGYGALLDFLRERRLDLAYHGVDVTPAMVEAGRRRNREIPDVHFYDDPADLPVSDYTVACGVFNLKLDVSTDDWRAYVLRTLDGFPRISRRGFAFNMLTSYSDPERMRDDLFYADPSFLFDYCKRNYSRRVAVLHDYTPWEFTVLVRLGDS